jgi:hypothetical protein
MLKLSDSMTAHTECLKIYPPTPNFQEVYKCFSKEISMMWHTKALPVSLPPRDYIICFNMVTTQLLLSNTFLDTTYMPYSQRDRRQKSYKVMEKRSVNISNKV